MSAKARRGRGRGPKGPMRGAARKAKSARPARAAPARPPRLVLEEPAGPGPGPAPPPAEPPAPVVSPEDLLAGLPPPEPGKQPRRFIILDTNALLMQFQFSVDIENELRRLLDFDFEVVVPDVVLGELRHLAGSMTGKDRGEALMALRLAHTFRLVRAEGPADTAILRLAEKLNGIVVTNDKILRARLRAKNLPNIHLRSKAFLTVEGHLGF